MNISSFAISLFVLILIPFSSYAGEPDSLLLKLEDINKAYKDFVFRENKELSSQLYNCALSEPVDTECIDIITQIKDLTYKLLGEVDSFATLYKTIVYGKECLDEQLKLDLYSAIYHARNEYSLMQLDLEKICTENKPQQFLSTRCKSEKKFDNELVEITDYILNNMSIHVNIADK